MQAVQIATDPLNLISGLSPGVSKVSAEANLGESHFNVILKDVQGKAGNAKSVDSRRLSVEAKPSRSTMEKEDASSTSDVAATATLVQNSDTALQQDLTQDTLSARVFYGTDFTGGSTLQQSNQSSGTQNIQLTSPQLTGKLPLFLASSVFTSKDQNSLSKNAVSSAVGSTTGSLLGNSGQTTTLQAELVSCANDNEVGKLLKSTQDSEARSFFPIADVQSKGPIAVTRGFAQNTTIPVTSEAAATLSEMPTPTGLQAAGAIGKINKPLQQDLETSEMSSINGTIVSPNEVAGGVFHNYRQDTLQSKLEQSLRQNAPGVDGEILTGFNLDGTKGKQEEINMVLPGSLGYQNVLPVSDLTTTAADTTNLSSNIDPHNIVTQIVDQARLIHGVNNSEMVIQLKPEHLGDLTLKIAVSNGSISATFHSNNNEVRTVLEASIAQFKQEMASAGVKVSHVGIYAGLDQFFSGGQQNGHTWQYAQSTQAQSQRFDDEVFQEIEALTASQVTSSQSTGVDYRI
ncbi:MAG: Flagellar hook-length control protein-like protein [Firmicutes bacterium]|nr:Flagellar hook-length control protein-like protein [Bacillota bacterium]